MLRRAVLAAAFLTSLLVGSAARADDADGPPYDPNTDECADPAAHCAPEQPDLDETSLEAQELAAPTVDDPIVWTAAAGDVACPEASTLSADGRCTPDVTAVATAAGDVGGGCATTRAPISGILGLLLIAGAVVYLRRKKLLLALAMLAACTTGDATDWDAAIDAGLTPDHTDVFAAPLGDDGANAFLLANQPLDPAALQPSAVFALSPTRDATPIFRTHGTAGDTLAATRGDKLLGWARATPGDGTAELVELTATDGVTRVYETAPETIDALVAEGYAVTASLGYVWPPGGDDLTPDDDSGTDPVALAPATTPVACPHVGKQSAAILMYASPGADETPRFLKGCPGEVIVGEKREAGPIGAMKSAAAQAAGGRSAFVIDVHGTKLAALLKRSNGVERTRAYFQSKLNHGYDYIVVDEITTASDWRDGSTANRRLRELLLRMPPRTMIPYISIDLVQEAGGFTAMRNMRYLLRAFKQHARALAMEVYLHTRTVMAGGAPSAFRIAADRLALSVSGMKHGGGINLRAITTIGTSMHSSLAQYRYLDQPGHDLESIKKQVNALRHGSARVRQQHGVGYYFVNKSDMAPPSAYSYDALIGRMRTQALRFK